MAKTSRKGQSPHQAETKKPTAPPADNARTRLVEALKSLRAILARGPKEMLPVGIRLCHPLKDPGDGPDGESFRRFDGARQAGRRGPADIVERFPGRWVP